MNSKSALFEDFSFLFLFAIVIFNIIIAMRIDKIYVIKAIPIAFYT